MEKIYMKARAKINLTLEILEKRLDNYHNLKSIFQKINLYDELYIEKNEKNEIEIQSNIENLKCDENIIYKAYKVLRERFKQITGVKVILNKNIPIQAGLAGGSTDCASFLIGMNKLFDLKLSKLETEQIGRSLGADVVPCMYNRALLAEGIGDIVTPINTKFKYYIVIVKPKISCSSKVMFDKLDEREKIKQQKNSSKIIYALENNNLEMLADNLYNVFEDVIEEKEIIYKIKKELVRCGASNSLMSGSGSCVFGIFENKNIAQNAYKKLRNKYETYMCISHNSLKEKKL